MPSSDNLDKRLQVLGIGRFQVMALLQAARYYYFNRDLSKAKSWGLNRAIFYAWAKYYGPRGWVRLTRFEEEFRRRLLRGEKPSKCPEGYVEVLGECVKLSPRGYYEIGGVEQTPYDYDQQVIAKIKRVMDPNKVWETALKYISQFPEYVLKDPSKFFKYVYEPVRDTFFQQLLEKGSVEPPREILERLKSLEELVKKVREKQKTILDFYRRNGFGKQTKK
ncbi:MAG: hypothetical protein ABWW65_01580 [Thermoprotei archaeon]